MEAGRRDRRIRIEYPGPEVDDGLRTKLGGWLKLCDRWAEYAPLNGAERVAAAEKAGFTTLKFRFRKPIAVGPISTVHRVVYRSKNYDIISVLELDREDLEVVCVSRSDPDPDSQADGED